MHPSSLDGRALARHPDASIPPMRVFATPVQPGHLTGGPTIADTVHAYAADVRERYPTRYGQQIRIGSLKLFLDLTGNKPIHTITRMDTDRFIEALRYYPPNVSRRREYRLLSAAEVISKARRLGDRPLTPLSRGYWIAALADYLNWLATTHGTTPGLLDHVKVASPRTARARRTHPFEPGELAQVFASRHVVRFRTPYQYWMPLLSLCMGLRISEAAQLYLDDVHLDDDAPWIEVGSGRQGQFVRHAMACRKIHVHPMLLGWGFKAFVAQCRRWGRTTLFPELGWGENGPSHAVGHWFCASHLRRRVRLGTPRTFDSLRATFIQRAGEAALSPARLSRWLGRAAGSHLMLELHYLDPDKPALSLEQLKSIPFDDVTPPPYEPAQFEGAFAAAYERERQTLPPGITNAYRP